MSEMRAGIERLHWTLGKEIPGAGKTEQKDRPIHFEQEVTWLYRTHPWVLGLDDAVWCAGGGTLPFDDMYVRVEAEGGTVRPRVVLVEAKASGALKEGEVAKKLKRIVPKPKPSGPHRVCSRATLGDFLKACEQRQRDKRRLRDPLSGMDRETAARQDFEAIKAQLLAAAQRMVPGTTRNDLLSQHLLPPEVHFVAPELETDTVEAVANAMREHVDVYQSGVIHNIVSRVCNGTGEVTVYRVPVPDPLPPEASSKTP